MNKDKLRDYDISFVSLDVSICSFMMAVSTFFTGFLIANYNSFDETVRIPILFLIIATFAFLYTSNIFGNASGEIMSGNIEQANKHAAVGTVISEFLGIYLLVISIPLAINALTNDSFLRISVFIVSIIGLFAYNVSKFSVIKRYVKKLNQRLIYSSTLIIFAALSNFTQMRSNFLFNFFSVCILVFLLATAITIGQKKEHYNRILP